MLGFTVSTFIKVFSGRTSPPHIHPGEELVLVDNSRAFNIGFMNEQIIGGWPSSHTTVSFAIATTLAILLPHHLYVRVCGFVLALGIGVGVTFGYHWFSEFVAGAILGVCIGGVVGNYFLRKVVVLKE